MATTKPVTTSGLYENTDGTVSYFAWQDGQLFLRWTEATWEAAGARMNAADALPNRPEPEAP